MAHLGWGFSCRGLHDHTGVCGGERGSEYLG